MTVNDETNHAENEASASASYDADSIQALEGLEAVRKRPAMYIGDTSFGGLHHLVYEVVDNSIDEALAGRCDAIKVEILEGGGCAVTDNGAGIPVGTHTKLGKSALEVVMTVLHAGGKFDRDGDTPYKVSGGLHGVGVSCVNALSEWLEAEVSREGYVWAQRYERGVPVTKVERRGKTERHGTRVVFKPDPEIFDTLSFSYDVLAARLRVLAFLNKGLSIHVVDERPDPPRDEHFRYDGGIAEFVRHLNEARDAVHPEVIFLEGRDDEARLEVEVGFQYSRNLFREELQSFVNNIPTKNGGTHVSGFRAALTRQFNRHALELLPKKADKKKLPSGDDYREGLTCVLSIRLPEPQFEGQTKGKLGNREVAGLVESIVNQRLQSFIEENPSVAQVIVKRALEAARVREAVRKAKDLARRKGALSSGGLPGKLWDCQSRKVEETEIFIVEGDSAGGSAKQGRDHRSQAILPIKGKILNVEKATLDKLLAHEEIKTIIAALGTGIADEFDPQKLRYGKIIIMTDADVDGSHIRTLLLTFFYRHMRELIEGGHIFSAQPPLYRIKRRKVQRYVLDDLELQEILVHLGVEGAVLVRTRDGDRFEDERLTDLLGVLQGLEEHVRYIHKRGMRFRTYLDARREDGTLPLYEVRTHDERRFLYDDYELEAFVEGLTTEDQAPTLLDADDLPEPEDQSFYWKVELLSKRSVEETLRRLEGFGFTVDEFFQESEEAEGAYRYQLQSNGSDIGVTSLRDLLEAVRSLGQRGLDIQRYKGLGEMNPDQLWETTMDPACRSLIRMRLVDAVKANSMFSILMGDKVEPRRAFIQRYALDVQNLDV